MNVSNLHGKTALVTGAGSGIGQATALALARRGAKLALCDVNESGLAETEAKARAHGCDVLAQRVDVAKREQMRAFSETVHRWVDAVDLLMNNAGVGLGAMFLDSTLEDWDWIVGINLMGVVHGCHFFLPPMVRKGSGGHVVNVSSAAGFFASPQLAAYCTTKFGVLGLTEALREELAPHGIGVTAVCPGLINTAITRSSVLRGQGATAEARERIVKLYERRNYGPERVAENILRAVQRNRTVAPISPEAWAMYFIKRLSPRLAWFIARKLGEQAEASATAEGSRQ
ncbi:MAG TPA: SDR family NAD(P)-dependent oxidoreductase [Myxococcota bacterium]|nr:SDR family NAD(P)-dependent oxidoreductase [Myxococcota bacterium]